MPPLQVKGIHCLLFLQLSEWPEYAPQVMCLPFRFSKGSSHHAEQNQHLFRLHVIHAWLPVTSLVSFLMTLSLVHAIPVPVGSLFFQAHLGFNIVLLLRTCVSPDVLMNHYLLGFIHVFSPKVPPPRCLSWSTSLGQHSRKLKLSKITD